MKDLKKSNSKELTSIEKSSLFAELTSVEAETTKGGFRHQGCYGTSSPRRYFGIPWFFNLARSFMGNLFIDLNVNIVNVNVNVNVNQNTTAVAMGEDDVTATAQTYLDLEIKL